MQGRDPEDHWAHSESDSDPSDQETSPDEASEFVSLEELGSVYAKVLHGESPTHVVANPQAIDLTTTGGFHGSISVLGETDGVPVTLSSIVESILFVGTRDGQAVTLEQLTESMKEFSEAEIMQGIEELRKNLELQNSTVRVEQNEEGFRLILTPEYESKIEELKWGAPKHAVLSQTAIDCLSMVAYQPGILRAELERHFGQGVGTTLALLQRRGLIALDGDGFHTTGRFLEIAGIASLEELPKVDDL